jgi:hypothetical protein
MYIYGPAEISYPRGVDYLSASKLSVTLQEPHEAIHTAMTHNGSYHFNSSLTRSGKAKLRGSVVSSSLRAFIPASPALPKGLTRTSNSLNGKNMDRTTILVAQKRRSSGVVDAPSTTCELLKLGGNYVGRVCNISRYPWKRVSL